MGGNALKNCETRRYQRDEYLKLEVEMVLDLSETLGVPVWAIPAYKTKPDFGDMDLLVQSEGLPSNWIELVIDRFESKDSYKNGDVFSFEYKQFQIDLILTPANKMHAARSYFAYNDLGNLLGRVAHAMGLKLGHDGLSYNWRVDTYQFKNVVLADTWADILPILGYDPEPYFKGFDTLEDIFRYVASGKFFSPDIYLLHNRNHTSRVRDAKRKTYMLFLEWCEAVCPPSLVKRVDDKKEWLPYLFQMIPGFEQTYKEVQAEWDAEMEFRKRFNGDVVKQVTGLTGKELGEFMKWIKERNAPELRKHVLVLNPVVVPRWIEFQFNQFKGVSAQPQEWRAEEM